MNKNIFSFLISIFFIASPVVAIIIDSHELEILFKEDPSCYLAHNRKSLFAFDRSHLSYINIVIKQAVLDNKNITVELEKIPRICYKQAGSEKIHEVCFLYVNLPNIQQIFYITE